MNNHETGLPSDQAARVRFATEWERNFAVSANAGSGKTTAISERLAEMALSLRGAEVLRRTAVVTFTKKAADQIGRRARVVLLRRIAALGGQGLDALDRLEQAFFGTIHSFCLRLARTHGQMLGLNLNPAVVAEEDEALWEEFLESDPMLFSVLGAEQLQAFLRHVPLEEIFALARKLDASTSETLRGRRPVGPPPAPALAVRDQLLELKGKGAGAKNAERNRRKAATWYEAWAEGEGYLPLFVPEGKAAAVVELAEQWMAPLKRWLAAAAAALAGELAERYRRWRLERGVQTYADQIDAAMAVLKNPETLDKIRAEGWRIILDEAQDTDPQQFVVLVEVARTPGTQRGTWPNRAGVGPRAGHFCLVGDGQQAIYGGRADLGNFLRHLAAFERGEGGERLDFNVTFRAPRAVTECLNLTLPEAFGPGRRYNSGIAAADGAPAPYLQVEYKPLVSGPTNAEGRVARIPLVLPTEKITGGVTGWLEEEARQIGVWLAALGPKALGARNWGGVCILAPRNEWLLTVRHALEQAGVPTALQMRKNRNAEQLAFAWLSGLLAVMCDPENSFEWAGVLREVFAVSDGLLAAERKRWGGWRWDEPTVHAEPLARALATLRPWVLIVDDEGQELGDYVRGLAAATRLEEKANAVDPSGGQARELARLLAQATERGGEGASPRDWLRELLAQRDDGRPSGRGASEAVNLLTSHSAKGLEWEVVIPVGLWRGIGKPPEHGLRVLPDIEDGVRAYLDAASVPLEMREARNHERWRELVRLLYVTLTRASHVLLLPWVDGWGGVQREEPSFATLWGIDWAAVGALELGTAMLNPEHIAVDETERGDRRRTEFAELEPPQNQGATGELKAGVVHSRRALPQRILPHQLAGGPDRVRGQKHEATAADGSLARTAVLQSGEKKSGPADGAKLGDGSSKGHDEEAIDYGLWWHETLEFFPWQAAEPHVKAYGQRRLTAVDALGMRPRAEIEWSAWLNSEARQELATARWGRRQAEFGVFAPLEAGKWMDGVIDLVLHDLAAGEVWVVDWKTNRRWSGETEAAYLARLRGEYAPQLSAYVKSLAGCFQAQRIRAWVYGTALGVLTEIEVISD